jgi:hypothetical protein
VRQEGFCRDFTAALGGLDEWERPPLDATVSETRQLDGYRRDADGLFRAEQPDIYRMISAS